MQQLIVVLAALLPVTAGAGNLNGRYTVASGSRQQVNFNDDYAAKGHEYFDIWSKELATRYGEAYWRDQGSMPLPDHIVKRFAGKVIAITGYEHDQVMVRPQGKPGAMPKLDVSVPISWAYNHHYQFWILGKDTELRKVPASDMDPMSHGAPFKWVPVEKRALGARNFPEVPSSQYFSEGNGGESRKSFHGYPEGFAQLIESPTTWHAFPMQVDTANRDCGVKVHDVPFCRDFQAGPEPRSARYGRTRQRLGTNYSALLECPCTDRFGGDPLFYPEAKTKVFKTKYDLLEARSCAEGTSTAEITNASACLEAARALNLGVDSATFREVSSARLPPGCSASKQPDGSLKLFLNHGGVAECSGGIKRSGSGSSKVGVSIDIELTASHYNRSSPGVMCQSHSDHALKEFPMEVESYLAALSARDACETWCLDEEQCWGCSVDCSVGAMAYGIPVKACLWKALSDCPVKMNWAGSVHGDISEKTLNEGVAKITMSGPADVWFGAGFDAELMANQPYSIIVTSAEVFEQKLGTCGDEADHCAGTRLKPSVKVISSTVENNRRTVVLTRALQGVTQDHFSFSPTAAGDKPIPFITAVGHSQEFAHHQAHGPTLVSLTAEGGATCICNGGTLGQMCHTGGEHCIDFIKTCENDLQKQHNPTCSSATYLGGLRCCYDGAMLLDVDQEPPEDLLRYHLKFRIWFQEYTPPRPPTVPASHINLERIYYQTEAQAGEYEVPPAFASTGETLPGYPHLAPGALTPGTECQGDCPNGADCECTHTITYRWTVPAMTLLYAGGHCHAPACISIELINEDTNQTLCMQHTSYGQGDLHDKWDEAGYLTLPPCLWGSSSEDLDAPVFLPKGTRLMSIKRNRNTFIGHYGEMASWQMRGVLFQLPVADNFV
mmetsp:Transcript_15290/g.35833  ORF Transcript_15290/g.35833 Transcript_15290/m.35833 type:complete len:894 (+) Transcript_15290:100-2781(+)